LVPIYICKEVAREVSRLLGLSPALSWQQVDAYIQPQLPGLDDRTFLQYEAHKRPLIVSALERELRYGHVWRP
jgi:hypothetical protein